MAERHRWTIMWVPHGAGTTRSIGVSYRGLKLIGGTAAVLLVVALVFAYTAIRKGVDISRLERLERANQLLAEQVIQTRTRLLQVNDTVAAIMKRDEMVRLLAGLTPNDPGVQRAGIGGPAGVPSPREQVLAAQPLGREALQMQEDVEGLIRRANLLARSFTEAIDSLKAHGERLARTPSIMPTRGWLTSMFAQARVHPIFHEARRHDGIDITAPLGTPIVAPATGWVAKVDTDEGYGRFVKIDHGNGIVTLYAHCSKVLVREGQRVRRGEEIALVGSTGLSTSPHLHYEVEVRGQSVNPFKYIFPESIIVD
ncbi:MAG: M23 family metallopeptidase [Gemmatimonadetes bacterium]|nr:M23 family metallopeptidase [Gemmatimonadota bacterium]